MPLLGAHMSIAGGYYRAVEEAAQLKMDCVQIFTKNNNQWRAKPLSADDIGRFGEALVRTGIQMPCGHTSYLINLASPQEDLWQKSLDSFIVELERAEALGLVGLVLHPGAFTESSEAEGVSRVVSAIDVALDRSETSAVQVWLETTAGQGTSLGHRFEHIRDILGAVKFESRLGVCVDTCHIFAAGYPFRTQEEQRATLESFDRIIGLSRIRGFHLNDSKRELGSRVDRHEHIGKGCLGLDSFRHLLNNKRFASLPMYLETPKGETNGKQWDATNLARLRRLLP
ncbi:MAG: deoxyribonuclease IV, partial [Planctomycetaceae bacterium]